MSVEPLLGPVDLTDVKAPRWPDEPPDEFDTDWRFNALTTGDCYWWHGEDGQPGDSGDGPYRDTRISWVIVGGESGPQARPMHPGWAIKIMQDCDQADEEQPVAFHMKQWGEWMPVMRLATPDPNGPGVVIRKIASATMFGKTYIGASIHHFDDDQPVVRVGKKLSGRMILGGERLGMPA